MLRSLEDLEFIVGNANDFEIQMCTQGEMIEVLFDLQAFQLEASIQNRNDMIVPGHNAAYRRFAQSCVLLERFMEDFDRPSFLIGR